MTGVLAVAAATLAAALLVPGRRRLPPPEGEAEVVEVPPGAAVRWRWAWASLAGAGVAAVLGVPVGLVVGPAIGGGVWWLAGRIEPAVVRRAREEAAADLPHVVALLAAALRSGSAPGAAIGLVCGALPGAAADRLRPVAARLELGADPAEVWRTLAADPALGPLGRTLARTHRTGAPVVASVERLAADLAERARGEVEDRARTVGVRAAVPLGLCLLPGFLLLGIVPLVAGLIGTMRL